MTAPNPVAFTIAGLDIRWYGILISLGVVLAVIISYIRTPKHGIEQENVLDAAIWLLPFGIIGARAYYVIFSWDLYKNNLSEIFNIRGGGLAIHGGLIFGILGVFIMCRLKKVDFLSLLDLLAPSVALAQAIGRWGNFFNSEAHGTPTNLPWAIEVAGQKVHPTFLYESIWCFALFLFLIIIDRNGSFRGKIFSLYCMLYSLERFFVESLRTDSLMIGPFRQAQVISVAFFIFSLILFIVCKSRAGKKENTAVASTSTRKKAEKAERKAAKKAKKEAKKAERESLGKSAEVNESSKAPFTDPVEEMKLNKEKTLTVVKAPDENLDTTGEFDFSGIDETEENVITLDSPVNEKTDSSHYLMPDFDEKPVLNTKPKEADKAQAVAKAVEAELEKVISKETQTDEVLQHQLDKEAEKYQDTTLEDKYFQQAAETSSEIDRAFGQSSSESEDSSSSESQWKEDSDPSFYVRGRGRANRHSYDEEE